MTVGISGYGEFDGQVEVRRAARCSPSLGAERLAGIDAPTLKEAGLDVEVQNWRMVAAAPGPHATSRRPISWRPSRQMVKSSRGRRRSRRRAGSDTFLAGDDFDA